MPEPKFTAKEINRIEQAAAKTNNESLKFWYQSLIATSSAPAEKATVVPEMKKEQQTEVSKAVAVTKSADVSQGGPCNERSQKNPKDLGQGISM